MFYDGSIKGKVASLSSVTEDDAEFILKLRCDPMNSKYLHKTDCDVDLQQHWIREQLERKGDYYFIVSCNKDGRKVGLISLYNIDENKKTGEFGRWICPFSPL